MLTKEEKYVGRQSWHKRLAHIRTSNGTYFGNKTRRQMLRKRMKNKIDKMSKRYYNIKVGNWIRTTWYLSTKAKQKSLESKNGQSST